MKVPDGTGTAVSPQQVAVPSVRTPHACMVPTEICLKVPAGVGTEPPAGDGTVGMKPTGIPLARRDLHEFLIRSRSHAEAQVSPTHDSTVGLERARMGQYMGSPEVRMSFMPRSGAST